MSVFNGVEVDVCCMYLSLFYCDEKPQSVISDILHIVINFEINPTICEKETQLFENAI